MTDRPPPTTGLLPIAWGPLLRLAETADEQVGWTPTALPGWTVRDLLYHLATDAQRALVALFTPARGWPDTDHVTYWRSWTPGTDGAQAGLRGTRTIASQWSSVRGPADLFVETAQAALRAIAHADPTAVVVTQGHRLTVGSLVQTLVVEATIHHLDLPDVLTGPPDRSVLAVVREVLDALNSAPAPAAWTDVRYARLATGRATPTAEELAAFAPAAAFPLFG